VALYLDEVGQLKHLPANPRAVAIAALCGYDNVPLVGDMFIARTRVLPGTTPPPSSSSSSSLSTRLEHVDFGMEDLDSGAAWMRQAKADNYDAAAAVADAAVAPRHPDARCHDASRHVDWRPRLLVAACTGVAILLASQGGWLRNWPRSRVIGYLGRISYSLFLIHFSACLVVSGWLSQWRLTPTQSLAGMVAAWVASLICAILFYHLVERPCWRRRSA
jgi:hypothetical protein